MPDQIENSKKIPPAGSSSKKWYRHHPSLTSTGSSKEPSSSRSTVPTGIPLPPTSTSRSSKIRHEPGRTTKTAPKTVFFPESSSEQPASAVPLTTSPQFLPEVSPPQQKQDYEEDEKRQMRRVSAYLQAESFNFKRVLDYLSSRKPNSVKRFDEVIYTLYSFTPPPYPSKDQDDMTMEELVASEEPIGQVFIFEYGVIVIWGLEEAQELLILQEFAKMAVDVLDQSDIQLESFQFCHDQTRPPRLYNDVISLRSSSPLIKLTISHALAQSVKLTHFEGVVESTILSTKDIPYALAATGAIQMSRKAITKQIGELLITRINVNLVSNVLDAPEIFWSEPAYAPLYQAVRAYLEINQRVDLLNQRCAVISDMLDLLRDHANSIHAEYLEWIIIVLITIEILLGLIEIGMGALSHISFK